MPPSSSRPSPGHTGHLGRMGSDMARDRVVMGRNLGGVGYGEAGERESSGVAGQEDTGQGLGYGRRVASLPDQREVEEVWQLERERGEPVAPHNFLELSVVVLDDSQEEEEPVELPDFEEVFSTPIRPNSPMGNELVAQDSPERQNLDLTFDLTVSPDNTTAKVGSTEDLSYPTSIKCPICFDSLEDFRAKGTKLVSTMCGHLFCSLCLSTCLMSRPVCPTCRTRCSVRDFHPVFLNSQQPQFSPLPTFLTSLVNFPCRLQTNSGGGPSLYRAAAQHAGLGQEGFRELRSYCHSKLLEWWQWYEPYYTFPLQVIIQTKNTTIPPGGFPRTVPNSAEFQKFLKSDESLFMFHVNECELYCLANILGVPIYQLTYNLVGVSGRPEERCRWDTLDPHHGLVHKNKFVSNKVPLYLLYEDKVHFSRMVQTK